MGITPFIHQAEWWLASDGITLLPSLSDSGYRVQYPDGSVHRHGYTDRVGGVAHVIADLGAFKVGKSFGAGIWGAGFACIPDSRISLVGLEYDMCAPEFEYICEALLSERGMGLKPTSLQNRPRDGRMYLDLENGSRYEAKSWERKDSLKGKEIDAYIFCEAYQLPGLECYTSVKQNLDARAGYALFPTTPDRPWVQVFHDKSHGMDKDFYDWHCTCSVPRSVNPFTYDSRGETLDKELMTSEKYQIAYLGKIGEYVGRVYNYQRGERVFSSQSHPDLFKGGDDFLHLSIPDGWKMEGAVDTGTFMAGLVVAVSPEGEAFVIWEEPNYRYVQSETELHHGTSVPEWARAYKAICARCGVRNVWADPNSQFRAELRNYDLTLLKQTTKLEARTEISRAYVHHGRLWLAPWIKVLAYEMENARWPDETTAAGKFERIKHNDHLLDCLEHILSQHPVGRRILHQAPGTWAEEQGYKFRSKIGNAHLGAA